MTIWDIINPSDPYTLETDDHDVAAVVCSILGNGGYGLKEINGDRRVPLMLFAADVVWFESTFRMTAAALFDAVMSTKRDAVIAALDSVVIGSAVDRKTYFGALEHVSDPAVRDAWCETWHNDRRSSTNDIGKLSWDMARQMREHAEGVGM